MPRLHFPDQALVRRLVEAAVNSGKPLMLAHDHGLYLCHDDIKEPDGPCVCAFVDGCDPDIDEEAHETANALVGFDDFGVALPLCGEQSLLDDLRNGHRLAIAFGRRAVTVVTQAPPTKPQPTPAARGRGDESPPTARTRNDNMTTTKTKAPKKASDSKSGERLKKAAQAEIAERIATLESGGDPTAATESPTIAPVAEPSAESAKAAKGKRGVPKANTGGHAAKTAKDPKRRTNSKVATPKRVSALDAAAIVLKSAKEPMNAEALIAEMAKRKLWASPNGKTPAQTLYAAIGREIAAKGRSSRFVKIERGMFAINTKAA